MLGERRDRAPRSPLFEVGRLPLVDAHFEVDALVEEGDQVACSYLVAKTGAGCPVAFSGMFIATIRMDSSRPIGTSTTQPASDAGTTRSQRIPRPVRRWPVRDLEAGAIAAADGPVVLERSRPMSPTASG
jgi:hypothetical protein